MDAASGKKLLDESVKSWLWPDSRAPRVSVLREEHNTTVNAYSALLAERQHLTEQVQDLLAALEAAKERFAIYAEWCDREHIASRGTKLTDEIRKGCAIDANEARAAIERVKGDK